MFTVMLVELMWCFIGCIVINWPMILQQLQFCHWLSC